MSRIGFRRAAAAVLAVGLAAGGAGSATAEGPRVAVDIAPVHALVARVMAGVGTPELIVSPGASPHEYSLRPSEAAALQEAELVIWVGPEMTPWLADAIATLSPEASATVLMDLPGTAVLPVREGALFDAHDHTRGDTHDDAHGHDDGHGHGRGDANGHDDAHAHAHDPHAWLSPGNAAAWVAAVAQALAAADPDNAAAYAANAAAAQAELAALETEIDAILAPVRGRGFIVFHDAYQYFERAFDLPAAGAISISDAVDPGPARIAEIRARLAAQEVGCVLSEPQFDPGLVATVADGAAVRTGVLDPLGSDLAPGPDLYPQLMRNLARTLADCL